MTGCNSNLYLLTNKLDVVALILDGCGDGRKSPYKPGSRKKHMSIYTNLLCLRDRAGNFASCVKTKSKFVTSILTYGLTHDCMYYHVILLKNLKNFFLILLRSKI